MNACASLYLSLETTLSKENLALLFAPYGWQVRKCTRTDFEIICDRAELMIEADEPILMHGPVEQAENIVPCLLNILEAASIKYQGELYDDAHNLIRIFKSTA
jgi:hypothetical protein